MNNLRLLTECDLCAYVCHDMGLSLVDVVGDLHHDHSEGHRQARHAAEEGDGAEQGERAGVHPRPVLVRLRAADRIIVIFLGWAVTNLIDKYGNKMTRGLFTHQLHFNFFCVWSLFTLHEILIGFSSSTLSVDIRSLNPPPSHA